MKQKQDTPLIVQSDKSILIEVHSPSFSQARAAISQFSELVKSPEHMHTYKVSVLSLWNAASLGYTPELIIETLTRLSRFPIPEVVSFFITDTLHRFGLISIHPIANEESLLYLSIPTTIIEQELCSRKSIAAILQKPSVDFDVSRVIAGNAPHFSTSHGYLVHLYNRGEIKLQLIKAGYPVDDQCPLKKGDDLSIALRETTLSGYPFSVRGYQREARDAFLASGGSIPGGFGTLVLPCGSGKTIIGISVIEAVKTQTLIVTTNTAAVHQWIFELLDKTHLTEEEIGEYTGEKKELKPITVCTYQVLTWRKNKVSDFPHFHIFRERNWGLIIYDEVHTLPAPVFKVTAEIQAISRLGLTATLVREDNREEDVFSLVGPKRFDVPWKELEQKGWIAEAHCYEIRIPLEQSLELTYAIAKKREKYRIASENPKKTAIIKEIIANHRKDFILIIGQYIDQLKKIAEEIGRPMITGSTSNKKREELYQAFREGKERILVVSKVANFAIDLPDASVAIQISGTYGSRQEEAQRLGRILRPKEHGSYFYSIVTKYTAEEEFAQNRQKFLVEQGYKYHIENWD